MRNKNFGDKTVVRSRLTEDVPLRWCKGILKTRCNFQT